MTFNLPEAYKNVFTGEIITSPYKFTLAPGEFLVLSKINE